MKFSSVRLPFLLFIAMAVLLVGCERRSKPAEVIYRPKAPMGSPMTGSIGVDPLSPAGRPILPLANEQITMGLIVPLTGPQAEIGTQLRDAALMGLYDTIQTSPKLEATATPKLLMRDSGGGADATAQAAQELIDEGAQIILGPLVSENVIAAGRVTSAANIPLIAFSNNMKVAKPNVFVFGYIPYQQVKRISDFAAEQKIEHYAAIATQDDYGRMVVRDFSKAIAAYNHTVQPVEFFSKGSMPASDLLTRIAKDAEVIGRQRKAVFLPVTGEPLAAISQRFMQDVKANDGFLKLLGTGLWDNPQTVSTPGLLGAWFATTDPELSYQYNQRFFEQYEYAPSRLASLAYDAVSFLADEGIQNGSAALTRDSLISQDYYTPANGTVRFRPNGVVDRALAVVEVGQQGFRVMDAPRYSE